MKNWINRTLLASIVLLSACGPQNASQFQKQQKPVGTLDNWPEIQKIDDNPDNDIFLVSTDQAFQKLPEEVQQKYEKPKTEVQSKTAVVKLGLTDIEKIEYYYDAKNNLLQLKGHLKIRSKEDNTVLSETTFTLNGKHNLKKQVVNLYEESHSDETPLVRAKTTCLSTDDNDMITCEKAIIDFFISYKNQYFTEQFETVSKKEVTPKKQTGPAAPTAPQDGYNTIPASPTVPAGTQPTPQPVKPDPSKAVPTDSSNTVQPDALEAAEGDEDSINDRYQGQVQETDIVSFMSKTKPAADSDEDDEDTAQPPVVAPSAPQPKAPEKDDEDDSTPPALTPGPKQPQQPQQPVAKPPASGALSKDATQPNLIEKIINSNFIQLANGEIRQHNQAIGYPDDGKLRNATVLKDFKGSGDLFVIVAPERARFYATHEMATMIARLGQFAQLGDIQKIYVGNISAVKGGPISPHKSHQIGMDADLGYPTADGKVTFPTVVRNNTLNSSAYSVKKTYELFKQAFKQKDIQTEKIFADRLIIKDLCKYAAQANDFNSSDKELVQNMFKNINHVDGHGNHFHIRVKCTKYQPACRSKVYKAYPGCEAYVKK